MTETDLEELRTECRLAWMDGVEVNAPMIKLVNGPLRGYTVPKPTEGTTWQGTWFDDAGQQILVTYELSENDQGEYSGSKTMADIATDTANAEFDRIREGGDEAPVDLSTMSAEEARDFLHEDNARRKEELKVASEGQADMTHTFDSTECLILLRHLIRAQGPKLELEATLEFEDTVSRELDRLEEQFLQFEEARQTAIRQAVISGKAPPGTPIHDKRVTLPPRRVRRGG